MRHNPNAKRAAVFDWNGTLNDMGVLLAQNKHVGLVEFGLHLTDEDVRNCWGLPRYEFFDRLFGDRIGNRLPPQEIRRIFMGYNHLFPRRLHPDAIPTLSAIKAAGLVLALATTGPRSEIEQFMRQGGLQPEQFDFMHMQDETPASGTGLQPVVGELALRGISPREALFIGDEEVTRTDAGAVGMGYLVVANGTRSKATLLNKGIPPHKIIDRLGELPGILGIQPPAH